MLSAHQEQLRCPVPGSPALPGAAAAPPRAQGQTCLNIQRQKTGSLSNASKIISSVLSLHVERPQASWSGFLGLLDGPGSCRRDEACQRWCLMPQYDIDVFPWLMACSEGFCSSMQSWWFLVTQTTVFLKTYPLCRSSLGEDCFHNGPKT